MMGLFTRIFGDESSKFIKKAEKIVAKVNALEADVAKLPDEDFQKKTQEFRDRLAKNETMDDILPEAFALVREAMKRVDGKRLFDVQIVGGLALHQGKIAEMKTGEGKTFVAVLPAYLNAITGEGVHIITVNDYLSRIGAVLMGQVYNFLGLSVGVINSQNVSYLYDEKHFRKEVPTESRGSSTAEAVGKDRERDQVGEFKIVYDFLKPCSRRVAYLADVTYGTNHEYGFDYLRDNLVTTLDEIVQRKHNFAIVDEVDSILIDEARTPLIISSQSGDSEDFYLKFYQIAKQLKRDTDYEVDEKLKAISLTDTGISKAEQLLGVENIYTEKGIKYVHHLETAVKAQAIFERDKDYVVKEGEVIIVDPFTGRLQPGRRWSEGIHQAIEAKEGVKIEKETRSSGSITFQNYFRFYKKLSGMTGTAATSAEEFLKVYGLDVIVIPTNRPVVRLDHPDLIFQSEKGKFQAIAKKVKELNMKGTPVLIGTISIEKNELLSVYLKQEGVTHTILNAKNHEKEGEIIAQAGKRGTVTIATNMAGRGIDIKLGGNPIVDEEYKFVKSVGGLFVLGTERHEARRIDNQLRGRSGRQGDPGATQFYVSLEDDLMRVFGSERIKNMMGRFGMPEDQPIENRFISKTLEGAQAKIEGFHFDARKHTLEYDDVMNHQRKIIYERRQKMLRADKAEIEILLGDIAAEKENFNKVMEEKREKLGDETFFETVRRITLYTTDTLWMEHLEAMDYLRGSVNLRAYGQREPIVEYKKDGLRMFKEMEEVFKEQVASLIGTINTESAVSVRTEENAPKQTLVTSHTEPSELGGKKEKEVGLPRVGEVKAGRNDPCPCGSGKKYKKCHGK
ncbi:preprotein translocase subunit SecA [Candidatus Nomurabacteria bacterium RIFOXYC2_FULL_43_16]|uniref:Protein translocase subunit SecA n=2 Tax=Candidatus Nomuraibacteriota TaxID=1752729 RepID=A0A1F6YLP4_9BACT|nr:MAG: preprotein translocase subunit SecA [Candidatus Nomurabacteria bacterium RIFOXYB1_FULL_43_14]OGJ06953.1 MAG: preprotein translocase subunit SecA [Candidatus Nomurabacteria bacterium RIFOXYA1_FULL_42_12]OGJ07294.1 MAG: preprotein translocase subunit SecA [Candidatus Nomurabacteria bacterium RIFOXYA2_FULL_42_12]OGJ10533.1 MAG: preprotein translocase subunit SecA [Candidatus Nomurabacteria bacterium RIFOXYC2_FULL_43_16]OGJ15349.1 MAG: preprotein translocase subunit SecA [Candidatus Nomurab